MATVRQSGGDYTTLNAATSAGETFIQVQNAWTISDIGAVVVSVPNTTIIAEGLSRHPGYASNIDHYRLEVNADDVIDVNADNCVIDGLCIKLTSTGNSDEGIDFQGGNNLTVRNCIVYCEYDGIRNQDGIYCNNQSRTLTVEQTMLSGWTRGAIHYQNFNNGDQIVGTVNVNSCSIFKCGNPGEVDLHVRGGIGAYINGSNSNFTLNTQNCAIFDCGSAGNANSYGAIAVHHTNNTFTHNTSNLIYDFSVGFGATFDSGSNNLSGYTSTDSDTPGAGDWVVFENITTYPYDYRLKSNAANQAENWHNTPNAHGLTIPATDVVGTARPQNGLFDAGFFEIGVSGPIPVSVVSQIDALISSAQTAGSTIDANIASPQSASMLLDALVTIGGQAGSQLDALIQALRNASSAVDANVVAQNSVSTAIDAIISSAAAVPPDYISDGFTPDNYDSTTNPKGSGGPFAVEAGDLVVALCTGDNGSPPIIALTMTSNPSETWTKHAEQVQGAGNEGYSSISSAVVSNTGTIELTCTRTGGNFKFGFCWVVFRNHSGTYATIEYQPPENPICETPIVTQLGRSAICMAISDGFARSAAANVIREDEAGTWTSRVKWDTGNEYTTEAGTYQDSGDPAGSKVIGMRNPQDMRASLTAVEIGGLTAAGPSTQTALIDALVSATANTASSVDAMIARAALQNVSTDALIAAVRSGQLSLDAFIALLISSGLSIDALVERSGIIASVNLDAIVVAEGEGMLQSLIDALVQDAASNPSAVDALIQLARTAQTAIDALIAEPGAATAISLIDALVESYDSLQAAIDAMIEAGRTDGSQLDAIVQLSASVGSSIDAIVASVQGGLAFSNLDALVQYQAVVSGAIDAYVQANLQAVTQLDAIIIEEGMRITSANLDALIRAIQLQASQIDAIVGISTVPSVSNVDAIVALGALTAITQFDAMIEIPDGTASAIDALLLAATETPATVQLDSVIALSNTGGVNVDCIVSIIIGNVAALDSLILAAIEDGASIDAFVGDLSDTAMTSDRILIIAPRDQIVVIPPDDKFLIL